MKYFCRKMDKGKICVHFQITRPTTTTINNTKTKI